MPRVLLLTSHPVEGRDGADKEVALGLLTHVTDVDYTWVSRWRSHDLDHLPGRRLSILSTRGRAGLQERLQSAVRGGLAQRSVDLVHVVSTIGPHFGRSSQVHEKLTPPGIPIIHTVPAVSRPADLLDARPLGLTVAASRATARLLQDAGFPHVTYIPTGIEVERWRGTTPRLSTRPTVFFAGHHDPGGGADDVIAGAAAVQRSGTPVRLVMAMRSRGRHGARDARYLLESASRQGLDEVAVHGRVDDMPALVGSSTVVVFPPQQLVGGKADVPLVVLEAMAAGRPVVVSDLPQLEALGDAVVRVPPGDAGALAAAIKHLVVDRAGAAELAARATLLVEQEFSAATMAQRYRALYDSVLAGQAPAATSS